MNKLLLLLIIPLLSFGQCIQGDCIHGFGTYVFQNGDKYIGEFKNSQLNGNGTLTFSSDNIQKQLRKKKQWSSNVDYFFLDIPEYSGLDKLTYKKYEGEFKNDKFHGTGVLMFEEGVLWSGIFSRGAFHMGCVSGDCENGFGVMIMLWVDLYVGEFKDGERHGKGTYTWGAVSEEYYETGYKHLAEVGGKYVGDWKKNRRTGFGVYTSNDGSSYEGEYRNNQKHGKGIYISSQIDYEGIGATLSAGIDSNYVVFNKLYKGLASEKAGLIKGDKIIKINGENVKGKPLAEVTNRLKGAANTKVNILVERNGKRLKFIFNRERVILPGHKYIGEFKDNKRYGKGTYTSSFGEKRKGLFKENKFISGKCWDENGIKFDCGK